MSTFCPLCGSAVDDGETCSCQSQGIQPVILEGLIQEQTIDLGASSPEPAVEIAAPQPQVEIAPQPAQQQQAAPQPVQIQESQPLQPQVQPQQLQAQPQQAAPQQQQMQQAQPQQAAGGGVDIAPKPSAGVDIEIGAPRKQSRPTPDMSFGANPMMKLDLGLDDEPARGGVNIAPGPQQQPQQQQPSGGVDIGGRAPQQQPPQPQQQQPSGGVDIGGRAPQQQPPQPSVGVDIGGRAPQQQPPQPSVGVDIGGRPPQPQQAAPQKSKKDSLREKYERQDRMIMEKAGLLPKEEEKEEEQEEQQPEEEYTIGEFFEDLKYEPANAIANFVEQGSLLFAIVFMLVQALVAGLYTAVFGLRHHRGIPLSAAQFMLMFIIGAMFILLGNIVLAFVEMKMLEGSSSEAYIQRMVAVISMYALASAPCLLLASLVGFLSPLASVPFAAAAWVMGAFVKGIAFGGLRDLDGNRTLAPILASCGIQGVLILLIGFILKIFMG